ncbi:MAG: copper chaperone PCu(A)C [Alphaproteobacteria bacterium]
MNGRIMWRIAPLFMAVVMAASVAVAGETKVGALEIEDAWARPSAGRTGAAYMKIENKGATPDRLVAVETPRAKRAELHISVMKDDVMRMRQVKGIDVPSGGEAVLRPGGLHVMLMGLAKPLVAGEHFPLTLVFEHAGRTTLDIEVRPMGAGGHKSQSGGHKSHN